MKQRQSPSPCLLSYDSAVALIETRSLRQTFHDMKPCVTLLTCWSECTESSVKMNLLLNLWWCYLRVVLHEHQEPHLVHCTMKLLESTSATFLR